MNAATGVAVLPGDLCTSFVEMRPFPMLHALYHDGTIERGLIEDGVNQARPLRSWKLARRLPAGSLQILLELWERVCFGGLKAIYFYDPYDVAPGARVGSNFDASGIGVQGRVTVVFRGDWRHVLSMGSLSDVPDLMLLEVS